MVNLREWQNSIFPPVTITSASSGWTKKTEEESTNGQERSTTSTKAILREGKGMDEGLFGGRMEAGTRASLRRGFKVGRGCCSGKGGISSMRGCGITACLMEEGFSTLRTGRDMKEVSRRTSLRGMGCFTRRTLSYTECGRITSYRW